MAEELSLSMAPKNGYVLAYFRTGVVFRAYNGDLEEVLSGYPGEQLLELHAFDEEKEYRIVQGMNGQSRTAMIFDEKGKDFKIEKVVLEDKFLKDKSLNGLKQLKIVNYIDYDENGMLFVYNYRIAPGEGGVSDADIY